MLVRYKGQEQPANQEHMFRVYLLPDASIFLSNNHDPRLMYNALKLLSFVNRQPRNMHLAPITIDVVSDTEEKRTLSEFAENKAQIQAAEKAGRDKIAEIHARTQIQKAVVVVGQEEADIAIESDATVSNSFSNKSGGITIKDVTNGDDSDDEATEKTRKQVGKNASSRVKSFRANSPSGIAEDAGYLQPKSAETSNPENPPVDEDEAQYNDLLKAISSAQDLLAEELGRLLEKIKKSVLHKKELKASETAFRNVHDALNALSSELGTMKADGEALETINAHGKQEIQKILTDNFNKAALLHKHTLPIITQMLRALVNIFIAILPGLGSAISYACKERIKNSNAENATTWWCGSAVFFGFSTRREVAAARVKEAFNEVDINVGRRSLLKKIKEVGKAYEDRQREQAAQQSTAPTTGRLRGRP